MGNNLKKLKRREVENLSLITFNSSKNKKDKLRNKWRSEKKRNKKQKMRRKSRIDKMSLKLTPYLLNCYSTLRNSEIT